MALEETWRWVQYGAQDGLPSADVLQIVETTDASIWASTSSGLAWFDGYHWHAAPCKLIQHGAWPSQIRSYGPSEVLGIANGKAIVFGRNSCKAFSLSFEGKPMRLLASGQRTEGQFIVQDSERNFYLWDGESHSTGKMLLRGNENLSHHLSSLAGAPVFYSNPEGLFRLDPAGPSLVKSGDTLGDRKLLTGLMVRSISSNRKGEGVMALNFPPDWIGAWEWGSGGQVRRVSALQGQVSRVLAINEEGSVLSVANSAEAWLREDGTWSRLYPVPAPLRTASQAVFDSSGRLWVATSQGIHLMRAHLSHWSRLEFPSPDLRNHVNALHAATDGRLWMGTGTSVVILGPDGSTETITSVLGRKINFVTTIAEDPSGAIWLSSGSGFDGVFRLRNGVWKHFGPTEGLPSTAYHKIQVDQQGRVWALASGRGNSLGPTGAFRFDGQRFEHWDQKRGLVDSRVYDVASSADGTLWFATVSAISRLDATGWQHWTAKEGLTQAAPFRIQLIPTGGAFFLDRRNGIGRISAKGQVQYFAIGASAPSLATWDRVEDPKGNVWVATRGGLLVHRNENWALIGPAAGLDNPELWPLAYWRGHVCMGTDGSGLYCLSDSILKRPPPRVKFEEPNISGSEASLSWRVFGFEESSNLGDSRTRYRIDGGPWSSWISANATRLVNLTPGRHKIEFEAIDQYGALAMTAHLSKLCSPPPSTSNHSSGFR